ncbi:hypothetical protein AAC387_Pa05g1708 [Persea americana]
MKPSHIDKISPPHSGEFHDCSKGYRPPRRTLTDTLFSPLEVRIHTFLPSKQHEEEEKESFLFFLQFLDSLSPALTFFCKRSRSFVDFIV